MSPTDAKPPANNETSVTRFVVPVETEEAAELVKKGMQIAIDRIIDGLRKLAQQTKGKSSLHLNVFIEDLADSIEKTPITVEEIQLTGETRCDAENAKRDSTNAPVPMRTNV